MKNALMAGVSFAHLLGRAPKKEATATAAAVSAETDDFKQGDDESDEDFSDRMENVDELPDERKQDTDESDEDYAERMRDLDGGDDEEARKARKAKKAKKANADEDDDEEGDDGSDGADMRKKSARAARLRERARCSAIFSDAAAGKNPALAASIAFGTDLPRGQALSVLRAGGLAVASAPRRPSLDERMAAVKTPAIGAGDVATPAGATGLAAQIVAAGQRARGKA